MHTVSMLCTYLETHYLLLFQIQLILFGFLGQALSVMRIEDE